MVLKLKDKWLYLKTRVFSRIFANSIFYLLYPILIFFPIKKNKIVVSNFNGKGYGDNAKYICNYLLEAKAPVDIVWLIDKHWVKENGGCPNSVRTVHVRSFQALFEMFTAKIWIDNCRKSFYPPKRANQFYIQTWHAGFTLKQIEKYVETKLPSRYVKTAKKDSQMCDLLLFETSNMIPDVQDTFWYEGETFRNGLPRNDLLVNYDKLIIEKVYSYFNIDSSKKIIMYAPTFSQEYDLEMNNELLSKIIQVYSKTFNQDAVMLIRLHPNDTVNKNRIIGEGLPAGMIDASSYDDMQELLCATDTLVTDYSSTLGEMLIMEKKCFIYAYDYEEYLKDRGLLMDFKELPFPFALTEKELLRSIKDFSASDYVKKVRDFKKEHNIYETGHASQDIGNRILLEMKK